VILLCSDSVGVVVGLKRAPLAGPPDAGKSCGGQPEQQIFMLSGRPASAVLT
jgi:hypothetical protein